MAASVNNIAATFATAPILPPSSSAPSPSSSTNQATFSLSMSQKLISTSWNPHRSLHRSQRSSLINLYGPAGPPPSPAFREISTARDIRLTSIPTGGKLPYVTLTCLGPNGRVQSVALSDLAKGKKLLLVGVSAAFSPDCSRYVKSIEATKGKSGDLIACIGVNDEFVMRAWGQHLGVGKEVKMLSDGRGELATTLGLTIRNHDSSGTGISVRSSRFCLAVVNGIITTVHLDDSHDYFNSHSTQRS